MTSNPITIRRRPKYDILRGVVGLVLDNLPDYKTSHELTAEQLMFKIAHTRATLRETCDYLDDIEKETDGT